MKQNFVRDASGLLATLVVAATTSITVAGDNCPAWVGGFGGHVTGEGNVEALIVYDDGRGGGPALYAGGGFFMIAGTRANSIARWDGRSWTPLGSGVNGTVQCLAVYDDGTGAKLYAGGQIQSAGGTFVTGVASWDGKVWAPLQSGGSLGGSVESLATFNDGTGTKLYVGGSFSGAGGMLVNNIASWDGKNWAPLAGGLTGGFSQAVRTLATFDDGTGTKLYAGGVFTMAGTTPVNLIASWNGTTWAALGSGIDTGFEVSALFPFNDGSGLKLMVAGNFTVAGGTSANRIATWDGATWSTLGEGFNSAAVALGAYNNGTGGGTQLYAGGAFTAADNLPADKIARWDGRSWLTLGGSFNFSSFVLALAAFDDGTAPSPTLFVGGNFTSSFDGDAFITKYQGCALSDPADLDGDGAVNAADLGTLLGGWGSPGVTDINGDGTTDSIDLGILLGAWTG